MAKDMPGAEDTTELAAEIAALRRELAALAGTVAGIGRAGISSAREAAAAGIGDGRAALGAVEGRIVTETQANPWRALGIAALGGIILGLFLRR